MSETKRIASIAFCVLALAGGFAVGWLISNREGKPAEESVFQTKWHGRIVKFCDGGRAVYSSQRGVEVVDNAPECVGREPVAGMLTGQPLGASEGLGK